MNLADKVSLGMIFCVHVFCSKCYHISIFLIIKEGDTPLVLALRKSHPDAAKLLSTAAEPLLQTLVGDAEQLSSWLQLPDFVAWLGDVCVSNLSQSDFVNMNALDTWLVRLLLTRVGSRSTVLDILVAEVPTLSTSSVGDGTFKLMTERVALDSFRLHLCGPGM